MATICEKLCLHYSVTWTVYIVQALGFEVSTLFLHTDCLLYYGIIRKTNVCISMACVFTIPTTVFLVMSSGVVYVVLALGVSPLVCPPLRLFLESLELTRPPWACSSAFVRGAAMSLCLRAAFLQSAIYI